MLDEKTLLNLLRARAAEAGEREWENRLAQVRPEECHIAVMVEPFCSLVLSGQKTVESRFSKNRISPWHKVRDGDVVIVKKSGGCFTAVFEAAEVWFAQPPHDLERLKSYSKALCVDEAFWHGKAGCRYATLMGISRLFVFQPFVLPFANRKGWLDFHG